MTSPALKRDSSAAGEASSETPVKKPRVDTESTDTASPKAKIAPRAAGFDSDKPLKLDPLTEEQEKERSSTEQEPLNTCNLVLFGLHPGITQPKLQAFLEEHFQEKNISIEDCQVKMAFASRYGLVTLATPQQATVVCLELQGRSILQKQLMVKPSGGPKQQQRTSEPRTTVKEPAATNEKETKPEESKQETTSTADATATTAS